MLSVRKLNKKAFYPRKIKRTYHYYGKEYVIPPITYYIFAFDSIKLAHIKDYLAQIHNERNLQVDSRIDTICVLSRGVITNWIEEQKQFNPLPQHNSELKEYKTKHALLLFYTLIINYLSQSNMPDFRFLDYLGEEFEF